MGEESEAEEVEEEEVVEEVEPEPDRDPLDVEEEALQEKLQTAGFLLSMPEEEHIRKRLLEIKQMRENPELFRPENTIITSLPRSPRRLPNQAQQKKKKRKSYFCG